MEAQPWRSKGPVEAPRARILMVDDHPPNLVALEGVLSSLGQELVRANSGEEALKELLRGDFAVILMDVQMPGLDGVETAALIKQRERNKHVPIIFITAIHRDPAAIFRGYSRGAVDYLLKPFDPEILRTKVQVFVDLWRKNQQIRLQQDRLRSQELRDIERRSDVRYRALTDSMPQHVWAADVNGEIYFCNRSWHDYVGPGGGVSFLDAVPREDRADVQAAWRDAVQGKSSMDRVQRLLRRDGEVRWHLCRVMPERDDEGQLLGFVATATDIDLQKRLEEERARLFEREQHARAEAEVANKSKDEFLATLSHELRTPLTAILGWTRMLRTGAVGAEGLPRALEAIERNARAQTQLIEDILDVSRIVTGKLRMNVRAVSIDKVVLAAVDAVRPVAESKGVELAVEVVELPDSAGDGDRLQQVVWNLLTNAIKFTPAGGRIAISLRRDGESARITVRDNGIGIEPSFLPHVFDRFRQADGSSTRATGGLGLGLAIVRHLVELHGGTVNARSEGEGTGSTFEVELPLREVPAAMSTPPPVARPPDTELRGLLVLVVDDEPDARELLGVVLETAGARVLTAGTAAEALELLQRERPAVLLSDIGLPREDGFDLIRRVRALPPENGGLVPAAALTAYATHQDGRRAREAGFHMHVAKPVEPDELIAVVAQLARAGAELHVTSIDEGSSSLSPPEAPEPFRAAAAHG